MVPVPFEVSLLKLLSLLPLRLPSGSERPPQLLGDMSSLLVRRKVCSGREPVKARTAYKK